MNPVQWIAEIVFGYVALNMLVSFLIDRRLMKIRNHTYGPRAAGPDWRALLWVPAYAAWARRVHDDIDAWDKERAAIHLGRRGR